MSFLNSIVKKCTHQELNYEHSSLNIKKECLIQELNHEPFGRSCNKLLHHHEDITKKGISLFIESVMEEKLGIKTHL